MQTVTLTVAWRVTGDAGAGAQNTDVERGPQREEREDVFRINVRDKDDNSLKRDGQVILIRGRLAHFAPIS